MLIVESSLRELCSWARETSAMIAVMWDTPPVTEIWLTWLESRRMCQENQGMTFESRFWTIYFEILDNQTFSLKLRINVKMQAPQDAKTTTKEQKTELRNEIRLKYIHLHLWYAFMVYNINLFYFFTSNCIFFHQGSLTIGIINTSYH